MMQNILNSCWTHHRSCSLLNVIQLISKLVCSFVTASGMQLFKGFVSTSNKRSCDIGRGLLPTVTHHMWSSISSGQSITYMVPSGSIHKRLKCWRNATGRSRVIITYYVLAWKISCCLANTFTKTHENETAPTNWRNSDIQKTTSVVTNHSDAD